MGKLVLLLLAALAIALAVTNPNEETHKKAIYSALATNAGTSQTVGQLAGSMLGNLDPVPYQYHNYIVFSTMSLRDKTVSVGALSRIWKSR